MKVTIRNVADAAGVSAMSVSKVLHGTGRNVRVSEATAERIRKVAKELEYQPNALARSLRFRKTSMVGVVFQHFAGFSPDNPYHPQLLNGIMAALFEADYTLALCPKLVQGDESGAIWDGRFDGVLWARPDFTEASVEKLRNSSIPLVMLHAPPGSAEGVSTFCANNETTLRKVVAHLLDFGHKNIVFLVDSVNEHTAEGRARCVAFLGALSEKGLEGEIWVWDETRESLAAFRRSHPDVTAVSVYSDALAGGLLRACGELGISVPGELSVVGFDSSPFCERTVPRLTSVHQDVEAIAFDATSHLLELIRSDRSSADREVVNRLYECELDIRDSTGTAPQQS